MSKKPNKTITKELNELNGKGNGEAVIDQQEATTNQQEEKDFNDSNQSQQSDSNQSQQGDSNYSQLTEQELEQKENERLEQNDVTASSVIENADVTNPNSSTNSESTNPTESTIQLTDEELKQKSEGIIPNYNLETITAILRNIFKKEIVDDKSLSEELREIIGVWKSDNYLGIEETMEEGSKKMSDEQKKVALVRNTMKAFRQYFLDRKFSEEDLRGMEDGTGNGGLFAKNMITKVEVSSFKQTMLLFCKYLTLLSQQDNETIARYLALYPPRDPIDMACLGGAATRIQELVLELTVSQQEKIFFAIHQKLINEFATDLRKYVIPGNQIHIESYVNHFLSLIPKGKNLDIFYITPQSEIPLYKIWKLLTGKEYEKSFQEKLRESESFRNEVRNVIEVINFIKEHKVSEVIDDKNIFQTLLSDLEVRYGISIAPAKLSGLMGYVGDEAVWLDEEIKKLILDNNPLFQSDYFELDKSGSFAKDVPTGLPIPKSEDILKSATVDQIVALIESDNQQDFNAGIAALWILGGKFIGSSISQFRKINAEIIERHGSEFTESIESTIQASKKIVLQDLQRSQIKEIRISQERIEQFYKSNFYLECSGFLDLLLYEGATEEEVKEFFQLERKETRPEDIFSERFLDKINVDAEYRYKISGNLMLRSDRVGIFEIFSEKNIIFPPQFLINCLDFCKKYDDIELARIALYLPHLAENKDIKIDIASKVLQMAAESGDVILLKELLEAERELLEAEVSNQQGGKSFKAIHFAAMNGHFEIVELLLANGAYVNCVNISFNTALHFAAQKGYYEIVELLLAKGADVNQDNKDGFVPLHVAAMNGHFQIVELLLEKGADVNHANMNLNRALSFAAQKGYYEIVELLLAKGAEVNHANENGDTAFHLAAFGGHLRIIELLLANGADINQVNKNLNKALHFAAQNGHLEIVQFLISKGAKVDSDNVDFSTALLLAACNGHLEIVEFLISKGANVNQETVSGNTAILLASQNGHLRIVELLISKGAKVDQKTINGNTALLLASQNGHLEVVQFLISKGVDVNQVNNYKDTPLLVAAANGHFEVAELLISKGADVNQVNKYKDTALLSAVQNGHLEIVEFLISKGAKVDPINADRDTALHLAVMNRHFKVVKLLLAANRANVNLVNKDGDTALFIAVRNGEIEMVELLLKNGANVDQPDMNGFTPLLHLVTQQGYYKIVELLLKNGANVDQPGMYGLTPLLHLITRNGEIKMVELLISKVKDVNPSNKNGDTALHMAAWNGRVDIVELLLTKEGINVDQANKDGKTALYSAVHNGQHKVAAILIAKKVGASFSDKNALYAAAEKGYFEVIKFLLDNEVDPKMIVTLEEVQPLHCATFNGHLEIVKLLISNGANINQLDERGRSPLHCATFKGHLEIVELLISKGADINQTNKDGKSPLHFATSNGHLQVVKLLISKGVDVNQINKDGKTLLHIAVCKGDFEMVKELVENGANIDTPSDSQVQTPLEIAKGLLENLQKGRFQQEILLEEGLQEIIKFLEDECKKKKPSAEAEVKESKKLEKDKGITR